MDDKPSPALPLCQLAAQITELLGHQTAADYRWLKLLAEFDRRHGWSDSVTQSCAHWLNWKCGIAFGAAREKVRVAHALEKLPRISEAMAHGHVSYSKVRALTRIASRDNEEFLLTIALYGTAEHVENVVRKYRRAKEAEELSREARQQANRALRYSFDRDGSLVLKARLPAEAGALLIKALEAVLDETPPQVSAETLEPKPSRSALRADALGVITESFLKHGIESLSGGERHQVVVHVDATTLRESTAGRCELDGGPSVPAETARRMACDASVVDIVENDRGDPLNVGRKTRKIPPALRRALNSRDQGCRFPGCCNRRYVDAHHIHHWIHGGETKPSNLVSLCRFHHRAVHEGGIKIQILDDGALRFIRGDGRPFDSPAPNPSQPSADGTELSAYHEQNSIHIDKNTVVSRWRGERIDYGLALDALFAKARHARNVSAGT